MSSTVPELLQRARDEHLVAPRDLGRDRARRRYSHAVREQRALQPVRVAISAPAHAQAPGSTWSTTSTDAGTSSSRPTRGPR